MLPCLLFNYNSEILKMSEDLTLLFHEVDPNLPCLVINERNIVFAATHRCGLCKTPYIRLNNLKYISTHLSISRICMLCLLSKQTGLTNFTHIFNSEFRQPYHNLFGLHNLHSLHIHMPNSLVPYIYICNNSCTLCKHRSLTSGTFTSNVNILPDLLPNQLALVFKVFNKIAILIEPHLQTLLNHLTDRN